MNYKLEKDDWIDLKAKAEEIIKNASKDIVIWDAILKEASKHA